MEYSKLVLGKMLKQELIKGFNLKRIASWACSIYDKSNTKLSPALDEIVVALAAIDAGPENELSQKQVYFLSELLMNNENDPLDRIKSNELDIFTETLTYKKFMLGQELKHKLSKKHSTAQIASWAFNFLLDNQKLEPEVEQILEALDMMSAGPEFEYNKDELNILSEMLMNDEKDPVKEINKMKSQT